MPYFANPYGFNNNLMSNAQTPTSPQNNGITWVQGIEGAKAFQMIPNSNALLMDSETNGRFYIKTCDNIGMCTMRYFVYEEIQPNAKAPEIDTSQFVTKTEFAEAINGLKESMSNEQFVSAVKSAPQYDSDKRSSNDRKR